MLVATSSALKLSFPRRRESLQKNEVPQIPAYAGMTVVYLCFLDRARGVVQYDDPTALSLSKFVIPSCALRTEGQSRNPVWVMLPLGPGLKPG